MPIDFDISIDLGAVFDGVAERADANAKIAMRGALLAMSNEAKALAPRGETGALVTSIRPGTVEGSLRDGTLRGSLSATAPGAEAQEFGSGKFGERGEAYEIRPRFKKALRFPIGGSIAGGESGFGFAKKVIHPGVRAKAFLQRGVESKLDMLEEELTAAVQVAVLDGKR